MPEVEYRRIEPVTVYAASGLAPAPGPEHVGPVVDEVLPRLMAALEGAGVEPREPGIFWYEGVADSEDVGGVDGAVESEGAGGLRVWVSWVAGPDPVEGEGWQVVSLPAVERAAVLTYRGAMAGIGEAWANLWAAVSADGHSATGPSREVYLVSDGPQESWVTELQIPVA